MYNNKSDFINTFHAYLATFGGGGFWHNIIGPNNFEQYNNIKDELTRIENDPYMQVKIIILMIYYNC